MENALKSFLFVSRARWALELQNYDNELIHRQGKRMQHVDALSRLIVESNTFENNLIICPAKDIEIQKIQVLQQKTRIKED